MPTASSHRVTGRRAAGSGASLCAVLLAAGCAASTGQATHPGTPAASHPATSAGASSTPGTSDVVAASAPATGAPAQRYLTAIRVAKHPSYDRVVFQFTGGVPSYTAGYVAGVTADASGQPVPLPGRSYLRIVFGASEVRQNPSGQPLTTKTYTGPATLTPMLPAVLQVSTAGDFEGRLSFGLGLAGHATVHISTLTGPDRVVLDIGHVRLPAFPGIWDITSWREYWAAQASVAQGHQPWLLSPAGVVAAWAGSGHVSAAGTNTFVVTKPGSARKATVSGTRPVSTGPVPVWVITRISYTG